jgi:lipopolysaccharide transport system ATP-binding protein
MTAIKALCTRAILMKNGLTEGKKLVGESIAEYSIQSEKIFNDIELPITKDEVTIYDFSVTQNGFAVLEYDSGQPIDVKIHFEINKDLSVFRMGIFLRSSFGECIFRSLIADWKEDFEDLKKGTYICIGQIPANLITAGSYILELHSSRFGIKDYGLCDLIKVTMNVKFPHTYNTAHIDERTFGSIIINSNWILQPL